MRKNLEKMSDWKNIKELIPESYKIDNKLRRSGNASIFAASLELAKEGNVQIKQNNLFDEIFIKQK